MPREGTNREEVSRNENVKLQFHASNSKRKEFSLIKIRSKRVHVDGIHAGVHVGHAVSAALAEDSHVDSIVVQLLREGHQNLHIPADY